ncbi:light-inducible protein CPRF2-like, partial [Asparagus officinalis]|uniref:light-inducible protein CPRF2-like n=1 Tax=Asparagus officinalis TaxID=4686 RepID=UPI00098DECB2
FGQSNIFIVQVKMAEDGVKRVTGASPMFPTMSDMSSISIPFSGSPSDATSEAAVPIQDDPNLFFQAPPPNDQRTNSGLPELTSSAPPPIDGIINGSMPGGKMGRTASMQRVASLEHLQKRIRGTPGSWGSGPWDSAGWDPETSGNKKHNQV